ncbi:PTS ascorbate transporter subunit IIC [Oceanirhabdus seepicola]|uniref:Ascorbate-specific PTS system EIIC component n=1 Tax=Oceanirhabdus seepicola TaxID=2828781 RepID=A0A9J6P2T5_9CLOT|nr:PTS ascorbate transporter subunit IIC [Oceanirhabdus seepicola]MCM1990692.1 PTS ascorbate transporter subunit IIC [Oceanirhabdus seepicola]
MSLLNFIVENIFKSPHLFLGLIAFIGLIIQRKSISDVLKGTFKTVLGVLILNKGVEIIAGIINPAALIFTKLYGVSAETTLNPIGIGTFTIEYGSVIGGVMVLAFLMNIIIARYTKFKNVFLTGHILYWMAFIFVAVGVESNLSGIWLLVFSTVMLTIYIVITPALIKPFVKEVTGSDDFTIGHTTVGLSLIGAYIGKWFGDKSKSTEDIKIPKGFEFLREIAISTGLVIFIFYVVVGFIAGTSLRIEIFGEVNGEIGKYIVYSFTQGFTFGAGITILLLGVRMMLGEIVPAFKGIADRFIPDAVPALDCPLIFPYAPNAVLIGFIVSMIASVITISLLAVSGKLSFAVLPLTVACFFDIGPAAVFGNATGGKRGAILASIICGVFLIVFEAISIPLLQNTVSDFVQAFGGNDFSIWTIVTRFITKIFGM